MSVTIDLPLGLLGAELRAGSFNADDNTIECVFTAGATVRRMSWMDGAYDEELVVSPNAVRLGRLNAGAPLLDTHSDYSLASVLGSVVPGSARIENGRGIARVLLSTTADVADSVQKIRDGIVRNVSTGYVRHTIEKTERDGAAPLWRVTDWEPYELSAVPMPADPMAQFRAARPVTACRVVAPAAAIAAARMRLRARGLAA